MQHHRNLAIPDTLADVCHPDRSALVVYDMQVAVVGQLADGPQVSVRVRRVLEAAHEAGVRVFFIRYMTLPTELMGISQLRTAMAWQRNDRVEEIVSPFLRDSAGFEIVPDLRPRESEAIFDRLSMSAFKGTPLAFALRDAEVSAFAIVGVATEGRHRAQRSIQRRPGPHPGRRDRRLWGGNQSAAERSLETLRFAGDAILTDISTITGLLARRTASDPPRSGARGAPQESSAVLPGGPDAPWRVRP